MASRSSVFEYIHNQVPCNSANDLPLTPDELEFFAEQEMVTIVPDFSLDTAGSKLFCPEGTYGPFKPNLPVQVPIYVALALYRRHKCRIQRPTWLAPENLKSLVQEERLVVQHFQPVPYYYVEVYKLLEAEAKAVFGSEEEQEETARLMEELRKVRNSKIRDGLRRVAGAVTIKLNNLASAECNAIRLLFKNSLNLWHQIGKDDQQWRDEAMQAGTAEL